MSRQVQTGVWMVLLEGVCRISVDAVVQPQATGAAAHSGAASSAAPFDTLAVTQLELKPKGKGPSAAGGGVSGGNSAGPESVPAPAPHPQQHAGHRPAPSGDPRSLSELSSQLKSTTRQLLHVLARHAGEAPVKRVTDMLEQVPAWRAADVLASALAATSQERYRVLLAVDHRKRIQLALTLVQSALEGTTAESAAVAAAAAAAVASSKQAAAGSAPGSGSASQRRGVGSAANGGRLPGRGAHQPSTEPGSEEEDEDDLDQLRQRLQQASMPPEVLRAASKELKRLGGHGGEQQPGYAAGRAYLDTLADLPWASARPTPLHACTPPSGSQNPSELGSGSRNAGQTRVGGGEGEAGGMEQLQAQQQQQQQGRRVLDAGMEFEGGDGGEFWEAGEGMGYRSLKEARELLDQQHYGLEKIKERVVEYLAVLRLRGASATAPILCFIGPPGVGKTSLARSVAQVLGRPFVRIALGGVRDEAEVRGHRRTYVGALPGRIIQGLRRAKVRDPVMLLDEVDKMGRDGARGDPASALLEVLDPEQNSTFVDAYLGVPFDLSQVTFVATANKASDIPPPLLDRLEVITLSGYTMEEKGHIASAHLLPQLLRDHGLTPERLVFPADVVLHVIDRYTREAGVRQLSRCLAAVCRHLAVAIVSDRDTEDASPQAVVLLAAAAPPAPPPASPQHGEEHGLPPGVDLVNLQSFATVTDGLVTGAVRSALTGSGSGSSAATNHVSSSGGGGGGRDTGGRLHASARSSASSLGAEVQAWRPEESYSAPYYGSGDVTLATPAPQQQQPITRVDTSGLDRRVSDGGVGGSSVPSFSTWGMLRPWGSWSQHHQPASRSPTHPAPQASSARLPAGKLNSHGSSASSHPRSPHPSSPEGAAALLQRIAEGAEVAATLLSPTHTRSTHHSTPAAQRLSAHPMQPTTMHSHHHSHLGAAPSGSSPSSAMAVHPRLTQQQQQQQHAPHPPDAPRQREERLTELEGVSGGTSGDCGGRRRQRRQQPAVVVSLQLVERALGPAIHQGPELAERVCSPGAAAGLVWTSVGGLVQYVECCKVGAGQPGRLGALKLTGQVGEVLVESAQIALSWIRSHAYELGLEPLQPPAHHTPRPITPPAPSLTTTVACAQQQQQQQQHPHLTQRLLEGILPNTATPGSSASGAPPPGGADVGPGTARAAAAAAAAAAAPSQHGGGRILEAPASVSPPPARDSPLCWDLHVHLPAGSIPKDGPSAGITLAVVLASMLSGRTVRADTAMTEGPLGPKAG
ncbi:MAG: hypothetical protein WDW36_000512 [Sanguina aurantia]